MIFIAWLSRNLISDDSAIATGEIWSWLTETCSTNPTVRLSHIPQCTILSQNGALWDICLLGFVRWGITWWSLLPLLPWYPINFIESLQLIINQWHPILKLIELIATGALVLARENKAKSWLSTIFFSAVQSFGNFAQIWNGCHGTARFREI